MKRKDSILSDLEEVKNKKVKKEGDQQNQKDANNKKSKKYLIVCGGNLSGIGKGTLTGSIGMLLKDKGFKVDIVKIEPYLNINTESMDFFQNGEIFITSDGGKVDNDIGNYERILNQQFSRNSYLTTGQIYSEILNKERTGDYLGKTVQVIPHVTEYIINHLTDQYYQQILSEQQEDEFVIIDLGGIVGDIENQLFYESIRELIFLKDLSNFAIILCSYVPQIGQSQNQKTKPTQRAVTDLRQAGLSPDFIICRSMDETSQSSLQKIAQYSGLNSNNIINVRNIDEKLRVPFILQSQQFDQKILEHFGISSKKEQGNIKFFRSFLEKNEQVDRMKQSTKLGIVGKRIQFVDGFNSLYQNIKIYQVEQSKKIELVQLENKDQLDDVDIMIMPGGHIDLSIMGIQQYLELVKSIVESGKPFLAIGESYFLFYLVAAGISVDRSLDSLDAIIDNYFDDMKQIQGSFHTIFNVDHQSSLLNQMYQNSDNSQQIFKERYRFARNIKQQYVDQSLVQSGYIQLKDQRVVTVVEKGPQIAVQFYPEMNGNYQQPSQFLFSFLNIVNK